MIMGQINPLLTEQERDNRRSTAEQILKLFSLMERHTFVKNNHETQLFEPEPTYIQ